MPTARLALAESTIQNVVVRVTPPPYPRHARAPIHLFGLGILLLLWNAWGALIAIFVQTGQLPLEGANAAYFASQSLWFVIVADVAPFAGVAGAVSLLLQSKAAVWLFCLQLSVLVLTNAYELIAGTSILLSSSPAMITSLILLALLAGQIAYARWLQKRDVLV